MNRRRRGNGPGRRGDRGNGSSARGGRRPSRIRRAHLRRHRIKRGHHDPGVWAAPVHPDIPHLPVRHNAAGRAPQQLECGRVRAADVHARRRIAPVSVTLRRGKQGMASSPLNGSAVQHSGMTQGRRGRHDATAPAGAKHVDSGNRVRRRPRRGRHRQPDPQGAQAPQVTQRRAIHRTAPAMRACLTPERAAGGSDDCAPGNR